MKATDSLAWLTLLETNPGWHLRRKSVFSFRFKFNLPTPIVFFQMLSLFSGVKLLELQLLAAGMVNEGMLRNHQKTYSSTCFFLKTKALRSYLYKPRSRLFGISSKHIDSPVVLGRDTVDGSEIPAFTNLRLYGLVQKSHYLHGVFDRSQVLMAGISAIN